MGRGEDLIREEEERAGELYGSYGSVGSGGIVERRGERVLALLGKEGEYMIVNTWIKERCRGDRNRIAYHAMAP
jgi:hypothetical protein